MSVITENEISSIIKERIDNFEYDPDKKQNMFIVRNHKEDLVYVDGSIDYPIGSCVIFKDQYMVKGVLISTNDKESIIKVFNKDITFNKGRPLWVTDTIMGDKEMEMIASDKMVDDKLKLSIGEQITKASKILNSEDLFFVCSSCGAVGTTAYLKQDVEALTKQVKEHKLLCVSCHSGEYEVPTQPTEDEKIIASFSPLGFISKIDHIVKEIAIEDDTAPHGVSLGKINSMDDVELSLNDEEPTAGLREYLESLEKKLGKLKPNNKIQRLIEKPNRTAIVMELAELKRKYKQAKKDKVVADVTYFKDLIETTKNKLSITHD